jgi:hypothetical protein
MEGPIFEIMKTNISFETTDWNNLPVIEHPGETGVAYWRTLQYRGLRIRCVEYSANFLGDHWCEKGHIMFCLEGEMITELSDGTKHLLTKGVSYQVSDNLSSHRTSSKTGVKLFIVDGDFLN